MPVGSQIEHPLTLALYELSLQHPTEVFENLAKGSLDTEHYSVGHRLVVVHRMSKVAQLLSKSRCLSCHGSELPSNCRQALLEICPDFFKNYLTTASSSRKAREFLCPKCVKRMRGEMGVETEKIVVVEDQDGEAKMANSWREIVDARVRAKTRYFSTSRGKRELPVPEVNEYSLTFLPVIWASVANRIINKAPFFLSEQERRVRGAPMDILLSQLIRLLGNVILDAGNSGSPHLSKIASQGGKTVRDQRGGWPDPDHQKNT